jgi:hypothetical protein
MFELGVTFNIERGEGGKLFWGKASLPSYANAFHSSFDQDCRKNRVTLSGNFLDMPTFGLTNYPVFF